MTTENFLIFYKTTYLYYPIDWCRAHAYHRKITPENYLGFYDDDNFFLNLPKYDERNFPKELLKKRNAKKFLKLIEKRKTQ